MGVAAFAHMYIKENKRTLLSHWATVIVRNGLYYDPDLRTVLRK